MQNIDTTFVEIRDRAIDLNTAFFDIVMLDYDEAADRILVRVEEQLVDEPQTLLQFWFQPLNEDEGTLTDIVANECVPKERIFLIADMAMKRVYSERNERHKTYRDVFADIPAIGFQLNW